LEEERLANVAVDAAEEIRKYMARLSEAEKERDVKASELLQQQTSSSELEGRLEALSHSLTQEQEANKQLKDAIAKARSDKEKALKEMSAKAEEREQQQNKEHSKIVKDLERKMRKLEAGQPSPKSPTKSTSGPAELDAKTAKQLETLRTELQTVKAKAKDDADRIKSLEKELKAAAAAPKAAVSAEDKKLLKKQEKELKGTSISTSINSFPSTLTLHRIGQAPRNIKKKFRKERDSSKCCRGRAKTIEKRL
jgi:chromosome segregation ATPase